jgi:hypothetical protein
VSVGVALAAAGVVAPIVEVRTGNRRWALGAGVLVLLLGVGLVLLPWSLGTVGGRSAVRWSLLVGGLVWCGPAADLVVRRVLEATRLPAPEAAAEAGLRAGRWIGRLERWLLVACVAAGQPTLAVLPIGGKALFRYAEVVADARADAPRLARADGDEPLATRSTLIYYVIVGSLASWVQAIVLGLLAGA